MGKGLLLKSGGINVDPNDLTATQSDIIKGKTALVNGSDEPVAGTLELTGNASTGNVLAGNTFYTTNPKSKQTGTMKDWRGTPQHIDARRLGNNRFEVAVAAGYHGYSWAGNSYEYMEYSEVASTLGLTAAKLAQGQSVCGLSGTYKGLGNAAAADVRKGKTFSTASLSNAAGTMPEQGGSTTTPGTANKTIVSANRYVTGNIVVAGNSNLTAGNIKKGVNIFGVTGSWEGYVATPTDLYKNGINSAGFTNNYSGGTSFESGSIRLQKSSPKLVASKNYNLSPYSWLKIEYMYTSTYHPYICFGLRNSDSLLSQIIVPIEYNVRKIIAIDIKNINMTFPVCVEVYSISSSSGSGFVNNVTGYIYRIYLE